MTLFFIDEQLVMHSGRVFSVGCASFCATLSHLARFDSRNRTSPVLGDQPGRWDSHSTLTPSALDTLATFGWKLGPSSLDNTYE